MCQFVRTSSLKAGQKPKTSIVLAAQVLKQMIFRISLTGLLQTSPKFEARGNFAVPYSPILKLYLQILRKWNLDRIKLRIQNSSKIWKLEHLF